MAPQSQFVNFVPLAIDSLAFGFYTCLFLQCVQILYTRRRANYRVHLACMVALYFLSTVHIVLAYSWAAITDTADFAIYEVFSLRSPRPVLFAPDDPAGVRALATLLKIRWVLANGIADAIVIHRCFVIWGMNWKAIALPAASYVCTMIGGFLELFPLPSGASNIALIIGYGGVFLTNVLASTLTAGRIWFMSRRLARLTSRSPRRRYTDLTAIILESGLVYPLLLIITVVIFLVPETPTVAVLVCIALAYHLVGIAPTLIIVRVGMSASFAEDDTQNSGTLDIRVTPRRNGKGARPTVSSGTDLKPLEPLRFKITSGGTMTTQGTFTQTQGTLKSPVEGWRLP
ncbi:Rtt106 domain-containing protein [Mycena kentingensis (nom. inval.)]|nr:Rtt106 domain-containing protein [Mycena kentingensis (nom. inval.)]